MAEPVRVLPCPTCRKPVTWSAGDPHLPFCSKRCRLIDLGAWADGVHRIPGDPIFDDTLPDDLDEE